MSNEYIKKEAEERQWRIERGVDPILYGKIHRVQQELIRNWNSVSWQLKGKANEWSKPIQSNWHLLAGDMERLIDQGINFMQSTADKLTESVGLSEKPSLWGIKRQEEKERERRMKDTQVDKMVEARRRRVEDELMQTIKPVN